MNNIIDYQKYYNDMCKLTNILRKDISEFDCIICLKRSGFMLGAFLSNQLTKPLFTSSEIQSMPKDFKSALIVDDKICTGKSIHRARKKLIRNNVSRTFSAVLYIEGNQKADYYIDNLGSIHHMFYEVKI